MSRPLERAGANVIWSCHIGVDHDNEYSWNAWRCLRPRLAGVRRFVFSRYTSLPEWLGGAETSIVTPGIDPGSTKNLPMPDGAARVDRYRDVIGRHGAAAAQGVIQAIAQVLTERLRPNDTLARMGGDEFAAVFHAATPPLIQSLADGLWTAVRE